MRWRYKLRKVSGREVVLLFRKFHRPWQDDLLTQHLAPVIPGNRCNSIQQNSPNDPKYLTYGEILCTSVHTSVASVVKIGLATRKHRIARDLTTEVKEVFTEGHRGVAGRRSEDSVVFINPLFRRRLNPWQKHFGHGLHRLPRIREHDSIELYEAGYWNLKHFLQP